MPPEKAYYCSRCHEEFALEELSCNSCRKKNTLIALEKKNDDGKNIYQKTQEFIRSKLINKDVKNAYILISDSKDKENILDKVYLNDKDIFNIGRSLDNDIILSSNTISREHGSILKKGDKFYIKDHMSLNGIYLNDSAEPIKSDSLIELKNDDRLLIGKYDLIFRI